jgi:hypothetical protein
MGALKQENYSFKNAELYDYEHLQNMSKKVFEDAIQKANQLKTSEAMDLAQEALAYGNMCQSYLRINIHRFMSMVNLDLGKLNNARLHCWHAIQILNVRQKNYFEEKEYFESLMFLIESQLKESKISGKVIKMANS